MESLVLRCLLDRLSQELSGIETFKRLRLEVPIVAPIRKEREMSEFVFLYRGGERSDSPQQAEQVMQKWVAWMKELGEKGFLKDRGQPLELTGKVVRGQQKVVTDGPYAESKDLVGGYTLVEAKDLAQAAEISKGCPIFDSGGLVEVRPVMQM